jgi:hypothetical protein
MDCGDDGFGIVAGEEMNFEKQKSEDSKNGGDSSSEKYKTI